MSHIFENFQFNVFLSRIPLPGARCCMQAGQRSNLKTKFYCFTNLSTYLPIYLSYRLQAAPLHETSDCSVPPGSGWIYKISTLHHVTHQTQGDFNNPVYMWEGMSLVIVIPDLVNS